MEGVRDDTVGQAPDRGGGPGGWMGNGIMDNGERGEEGEVNEIG